jgi:hypothetical protein
VRRAAAAVAFVVALIAAGCGGGDDKEATTTPAPSEAPAAPSSGALPQQLVDCYAKRGYKVESPADIHSAPPQVVQECFGELHRGGAAP